VNDYLLDRSCAGAEYILLLQVQGRVPFHLQRISGQARAEATGDRLERTNHALRCWKSLAARKECVCLS